LLLSKFFVKNFITKKNSCGAKTPPPPPHNFPNGPSLKGQGEMMLIKNTPRWLGSSGYCFPDNSLAAFK